MVTKNGLMDPVKTLSNNEVLHIFNSLVSQLVSKMVKNRTINTIYSIGSHYEMSLL